MFSTTTLRSPLSIAATSFLNETLIFGDLGVCDERDGALKPSLGIRVSSITNECQLIFVLNRWR